MARCYHPRPVWRSDMRMRSPTWSWVFGRDCLRYLEWYPRYRSAAIHESGWGSPTAWSPLLNEQESENVQQCFADFDTERLAHGNPMNGHYSDNTAQLQQLQMPYTYVGCEVNMRSPPPMASVRLSRCIDIFVMAFSQVMAPTQVVLSLLSCSN